VQIGPASRREDVVVLCRGKRLHDGCGWDQEVVLVCLCV